MTISQRPLGYCTNVHPGETVEEVTRGLRDFTIPVSQRVGRPTAAGLWLSASVADELSEQPAAREALAACLAEADLTCYTLNAFPYGNFHSERVKEQVYLPHWADDTRLEYTTRCARLLAGLLPPGEAGSISTVPLGFKKFARPADFEEVCILNLISLAEALDHLHDETDCRIRLAIEPEPLCVLETTDEAIAFFEKLFATAAERDLEEIVREYIGLCYDVCHQAVEYEDVPASITALEAAGIRLNKIHITCAVHADRPAERPEVREALADFCEPRYLHQTFAKAANGAPEPVVRHSDLTSGFLNDPPPEFESADSWRVHFHVPVNAESLGPLGTTRPELIAALEAVAELPYAPDLEVETYTWPVMRQRSTPDLVGGLSEELLATHELLSGLRPASSEEAE